MDYRKVAVGDYVAKIASRTVSPGGGSAAALAAALGAALNLMVINFGIPTSAEGEVPEELIKLKGRQEAFLEDALRLMNEDCAVFKDLMDAISARNATPRHYRAAALVPMEICRTACESMKIAWSTLSLVRGSITGDIECSRGMLLSAFSSASLNVAMNLKGMASGEEANGMEKELQLLGDDIRRVSRDIEDELRLRGIVKGDR